MEIKILQKKDYLKYLNLIGQFRPINILIDQDKFDEIYNKIFLNSEIYVAFIDEKMVGSITVIYEQKFIHNLSIYAHIEDVIVDKSHRHMKIGSKLLDFVKQRAKEKKCFKLSLVCGDNVKQFYLTNNFEERGLNMSFLL